MLPTGPRDVWPPLQHARLMLMSQRSADPEQASAALIPDWLGNLAALSWRVLAVVAFVVVIWLMATSIWTVTAAILVSYLFFG